jgi:hypothetical protein
MKRIYQQAAPIAQVQPQVLSALQHENGPKTLQEL